jgi:hypothetical protein
MFSCRRQLEAFSDAIRLRTHAKIMSKLTPFDVESLETDLETDLCADLETDLGADLETDLETDLCADLETGLGVVLDSTQSGRMSE